jgi:ribonucleoside-diphosphate reductase alpha chain
MFIRLANEFYRIECKYPKGLRYMEIYELFKDFKYVIPGGSMLYGIGNTHSFSSLGNCFVIGDTTDSYGSICKIDEEQIQLMKRRGGVGHDLSHLRPKGSKVSNAATTSTGAVSFMNRYSNSTREVAQGGRRGALMLTMNSEHPDIEDFVTAKDDTTKLTGANISVKVSDMFMSNLEFAKQSGEDNRASRVWKKLIHQAWKNGEPGVLFWDTIINNSPADKYSEFESISTNPCGEIPLCAYDTCRLMSINLFSFVKDPFTQQATFDYNLFEDVVYKAQRLMDDVIDLEEEKIDKILEKIINDGGRGSVEWNLWEKIKDKLLKGRRTGLSAIGLADCLAALNIIYGDAGSLACASSIYKVLNRFAYKSSEDMALQRGAFPIFDRTGLTAADANFDEIASQIIPNDRKERRNIALLTIPPSGSLSILAGITSGIEPVFELEYTRRRKVEESDNVVFVDKNGDKWEEYTVYHPKYIEYGKPEIYLTSTANKIDPIDRVKLQSVIQKHIDHSISSTINLPNSATEEQIDKIYRYAYAQGCKGITVYRDGCRDGVLINKDDKKEEFKQHDAPKRPKNIDADVKTVSVKGIKFCVAIGLVENKPYEVFAWHTLGWAGIIPEPGRYKINKESSGQYDLETCDHVFYGHVTEQLTDEQAAITRLVSTALRHGTDIKFIVEQLNKTQGDLTSFSKAIARVLKQYITNGSHLKGSMCEICGSKLVVENGCEICKSCGFTKCG